MRIALALIVLALAGTASADNGFWSGTTRWNGKSAPRGKDLLRAAMLVEHNSARRAYGSAPLIWDEALTKDAARYARKLSDSGQFAHDKQDGVKPTQGENLFMGTRGAYSYTAMARLWVDERRWFKKGRFPDVVTGGRPWQHVGHYTQIVWPATQRVGCALESGKSQDYLVCRYLPAGNYFGVELK